MAFYKKVNPDQNPANNFIPVSGQTGCCADDATENSYSNAAHDVGTTNITGIVIDGATYSFDAAADTQAKVIDGVKKAFAEAGYLDIENAGITVSGDLATSVFTIRTTATLANFTTTGADVALSTT